MAKTKAELLDDIEWLEKGNKEWRDLYDATSKQAKAARATARVAIGHLQAVLAKNPTPAAVASARDWLISIGSEPT